MPFGIPIRIYSILNFIQMSIYFNNSRILTLMRWIFVLFQNIKQSLFSYSPLIVTVRMDFYIILNINLMVYSNSLHFYNK